MNLYPPQDIEKPERMSDFFDVRADGYEQHMRETVQEFGRFYREIALALPADRDDLSVLDLGVGTGLELDALFERFPRARVTALDVSARMLEELARKDAWWAPRVTSRRESFLKSDLGQSSYDAVISSMALHHWTPEVKRGLYERIWFALRAGGVFVNADYVESEEESARRLASFSRRSIEEVHALHIDLPLTVEREVELLGQAGFTNVCIPFQLARACVFSGLKSG